MRGSWIRTWVRKQPSHYPQCFRLWCYIQNDPQHYVSVGRQPKHLDYPLVAGFRTGHKPLPLPVSRQDKLDTWRHQPNTAALVSVTFWLHFCTVGGNRNVLSIFIFMNGQIFHFRNACCRILWTRLFPALDIVPLILELQDVHVQTVMTAGPRPPLWEPTPSWFILPKRQMLQAARLDAGFNVCSTVSRTFLREVVSGPPSQSGDWGAPLRQLSGDVKQTSLRRASFPT